MATEDLERTVTLLNKYGSGKFGDEWWPGNAGPWLKPAQWARMSALIEKIDARQASDDELESYIEFMNLYGEAKFGDAWWPGQASSWLVGDEGVELESRLETSGYLFDPDYRPAPALSA